MAPVGLEKHGPESLQLLSYLLGGSLGAPDAPAPMGAADDRPTHRFLPPDGQEVLHDLFTEKNVCARRDPHGRIAMDYMMPSFEFFSSFEYALGTSIFLEHLSMNLRAYNHLVAPDMAPMASHMHLYFWVPAYRSGTCARIHNFKRQARVLLSTHGFTVRLVGPGEGGPLPHDVHQSVMATLLETLNKHHPNLGHRIPHFCDMPPPWDGESVVVSNVRDMIRNLKRDLAKQLAAKAAKRVAAKAVRNVLRAAREGKLVRPLPEPEGPPPPPPPPVDRAAELARVVAFNQAACRRREAALAARARVAREAEKEERREAAKAAAALAKAAKAMAQPPPPGNGKKKKKKSQKQRTLAAPTPLVPAPESDAERIARVTAEAAAAAAEREAGRERAAREAAEARAAAPAPEDAQYEMDLATAMALSLHETQAPPPPPPPPPPPTAAPAHFKTWLNPTPTPCRYGSLCKFKEQGCIFAHPPEGAPLTRPPRDQWSKSSQPCRYTREACPWGADCIFRHVTRSPPTPEPLPPPASPPSSPEQAAAAAAATLDECAVCLDKPKTMLAFACMHLAVCECCAPQLAQCVLCNTPTSFGKVYK